ncbi:hypothetical protein CEUSTIGMA_g2707.t1 [Chlamydomonas eustigma]|uniref:Uncharacterized protein n=1 Tax=Chlamydomonas eustigma TaxID=1157962 RepID=A0A250WXB3_9CHLO|nr:hypothetical protein CEUSTIGMA_g2707.t1 [Chlamydomonas eustigma]|eukprot:GAX75262.1 hypothetical protein CEUSTIGMA_g2707.t1 [Chlamydomonas eustigma]
MELLNGYGSGTESEEEKVKPLNPISGVESSLQNANGPAISSTLWNKLPPTKMDVKKTIKFQLPLSRTLLKEESDDEEESAARAAKRLKAMSRGVKSKLMEFLPPPKNDASQALGSGLSGVASKGVATSRPGFFRPGKGEEEDEEEDPVLAAGRGDGAAAAVGLSSNEAYRANEEDPVDPEASCWASSSTAAHGGSQAAAVQRQVQGQYTQPSYGTSRLVLSGPPQASSRTKVNTSGMELPEELAGVQFKEINQKELRYVDPSKKEANAGMRSALGPEFENELRAAASKHSGSRLARSKHQIGTLFHNAKMNEIELLEGKARSMKTKSETQAKYGW